MMSDPSPDHDVITRIWDVHFRDPVHAFALAEGVLAAQPRADERVRAWAELTIAYHTLFFTSRPVEGRGGLVRALDGFRATRDRRGELLARTGLARLLIIEQAALPAREQLLEILPEANEILPPQDRFWVLNALGATFYYTDRIDEAIRYLYEALESLRSVEPSPQLPTVMSNLAAALVTVGDYAPARELTQDALGLLPHYKNPQLLLFARSNLAQALLGSGDRTGALGAIEAMVRDIGSAPAAAQNHYCAIAAEVFTLFGRVEEARRWAATAQQIWHDYPGGFNEVHARWASAVITDAGDDDEAAIEALVRAIAVATRADHLPTLTKAYERVALRFARLRRFEDAYRHEQAFAEAQTRRLSHRASAKYYLLKVEHELQHARAERDRAHHARHESERINRHLERLNAELTQRVREIEELQARLSAEAVHDPLTQLFNRRYLDMVMPGLLAAAGRRDAPLALALVDLDHFKRINDNYGHPAGDIVLRGIGDVLGTSLRPSDVSCRWGGEEFCIVLPDTDAAGAKRALDALAARLRELSIEWEGQTLSGFAFSAGVAVFPGHGRTLAELVSHADRALYAAKNSGRNRVVISPALQRRAS